MRHLKHSRGPTFGRPPPPRTPLLGSHSGCRWVVWHVVRVRKGGAGVPASPVQDFALRCVRKGVSEKGRRAKFYSLEPAGDERLDIEEEHWRAFYIAVNRVLHIA